MARLHPVVRFAELLGMAGRGELRVSGGVVVEEKVDGVLVVAFQGRLYSGSGSRLPAYIVRGLCSAVDCHRLLRTSEAVALYVEVYSAEGPPAWQPCRRCRRDWRAYLVDAYRVRGGVLAPARLVTLDPGERLRLAEDLGLELPRSVEAPCRNLACVTRLAAQTVDGLRAVEGVVVKLYASRGHTLPARMRGLGVLEAKLYRWEARRLQQYLASGHPPHLGLRGLQ